jgi:hypothetical protein
MKKTISVVFLSLLFVLPSTAFSQLKRDLVKPDISESISQPANNFLMGIFDPSRMQMRHSFSMGFSGGGGNSMLMNTYMNAIDFKLSEKLFLKTRLGIMSSPYHTFGENSGLNEPMFFGGVELNYKVSEKTNLMLRIESSPYYYYSPYESRMRYNRFD